MSLTGQGAAIATPGNGSTTTPILNGTMNFGEQPINTPTVRWTKIATPFQMLTLSTSSADFGVLIVEDQGYGYGVPDRNAFKQTTTGSCFNCYVGVQFLPTQPGIRTGTLSLSTTSGGAAQTTSLSGVGRPSTGVLLTPVVGDFGAADVGASTPATNFVLTNATTDVITTGTPTLTGDFTVSTAATGGSACGGTLAIGESCIVPVVFIPAATGTRTGQLTVPTSGGNAVSTLTGTGSTGTGITFQPNALVFNNVPGAGSTTQTVVVTNGSGLAATFGTPGTTDSHFTVATNCATVPAGGTCSFTVTYTPTPALASGMLTVPVTTAPNGVTQTVTAQLSLTANYTQENAGIQIVPGELTTVHFGALATGSVSGVRVLRVNNISTKSVTIAAQSPRQFPIVASTCGALAPGASCTLSVVYAPVTNGDTLGTIFVQATATDGTGTLNGLGYLEGLRPFEQHPERQRQLLPRRRPRLRPGRLRPERHPNRQPHQSWRWPGRSNLHHDPPHSGQRAV